MYVCGDGNAMGRDVQEAVVSLLAAQMKDSVSSESEATDKAAAYMDQMKASGRFVLDIWS